MSNPLPILLGQLTGFFVAWMFLCPRTLLNALAFRYFNDGWKDAVMTIVTWGIVLSVFIGWACVIFT